MITTPMTFCSTVHVIEHVGARPLLVDVQPDTLKIDPDEIEQALQVPDRRATTWGAQAKGHIRAILPVHQLGRLPEFETRRREIVRRYNEAFSPFEDLKVPGEHDDVEHAWHVYALRLNTERFRSRTAGATDAGPRDRFIEELRARNIGASVHFIPIHLHAYYHEKYGYRPEDFPVAYDAYQRLVSLPLSARMTDRDVDDVIEAVGDVVESLSR